VSDQNSIESRRRLFAANQARAICEELQEIERRLWREAARKAKTHKLYADSTYVGDIQTGLMSKAGVTRRSMVRWFPLDAGGGA
jgi:hypothetical protein